LGEYAKKLHNQAAADGTKSVKLLQDAAAG
jgi:hypothetical protein